MLDDYKDGQDIAYKMMLNSIKYNRLSHAYLIDNNGNSNSFEMVMSFVKYICCPNGYSNNLNCGECTLCKRIDGNNYTEIKIIKPDGLWIKKDQMIDLQDEFSMKPIEGNKRVYIIVDAEKMNQQTANSILKFLEDPVENIIAILITNNVNQMLKTIVSRCQIITLKKNNLVGNNINEKIGNLLFNNKIKYNEFITDKKNYDIISNVVNFITFFEENGLDSLIYTKKFIHSILKEREDYIHFIDIMICFYDDILSYKTCGYINIFNDFNNIIYKISENKIDDILNKLSVLIEVKDNIRFNLNLNLLIDKMIIDMVGV